MLLASERPVVSACEHRPHPTRFRGTGRFAVFRFMLADRYATLVPNPWQLPNHISGGDSHALGVDSLARPLERCFRHCPEALGLQGLGQG